jgi:hypothetical protein
MVMNSDKQATVKSSDVEATEVVDSKSRVAEAAFEEIRQDAQKQPAAYQEHMVVPEGGE